MSFAKNAYRDENNVPTLIGVSAVDGQTPTRIAVDPTTGRMLIDAALAQTSTTFGAGGNTKVVTDANVTSASFIIFMWATPPAGNWAVVCGSGSFTITSSDAESSNLAFSYKVFPA